MTNCDGYIQKFRLRVTYKKTPDLAMLSHLEVARALEKTIRRSGLKYCVSQGFSPHMRISFGRALSVGISSENEIFDVMLKEYVKDALALDKLQKAQCDGLQIMSVKYIDNNEKAASTCYVASLYKIEISGEYELGNIPESIIVQKKKKDKTFLVSQYFDGNIQCENHDGNTFVAFKLNIIDGSSIKPDIFINSVIIHDPDVPLQIISINKKNILNF